MKNCSIASNSIGQFIWIVKEVSVATSLRPKQSLFQKLFAPFQAICEWIDSIEINDPAIAKLFCQLIPAQCPFERTIKLLGRKLFHIPPLCKLNPFYEQVVGLRFRALCYLADVCGEDVTRYC